MATRDITEGRGDALGYGRSIAVDLGIVASTLIWTNTTISYDVALGGQPFIYAINDQRPYIRETAPFKKDQFDNGTEPGEQSLTGWWIRSQSSFHAGMGIKFYDPSAGEVVGYRFTDARGLDIWTKGQVTLLRNSTQVSTTTTTVPANGHTQQKLRSISYAGTDAVLIHDGLIINKMDSAATVTAFATAGTDPIFSVTDDGLNAYWVTNRVETAANKLHILKRVLTSASAESIMFFTTGTVVTNAVIEYVKERLIVCINNSVYEMAPTATVLPTPLFTHPSPTYVFTSITASGAAIYLSGYNGSKSSIYKFTLSTAGALPTLTSAVVAAEFPAGEIAHCLYFTSGYMAIGTSKGVRVASVNETDGSMIYGPLLIEVGVTQPTYQFAGSGRFIYAATGVGGFAGTIRIDLGNQISQTTSLAIRESLRFSYCNDVYMENAVVATTTGVAMMGNTDRKVFMTAGASGFVYMEDSTNLISTGGYLTSGYIRYTTLEPKNFKRLRARGDYSKGSMILSTVDSTGSQYDHVTYDSTVSGTPEVTTNLPSTAQEYVAYKFTLARDTTDTTSGPIFKGYQAKATIATPRQRILQFPMYCYDLETDHFNVQYGYVGSAYDKLIALENVEANGDVVQWQDFDSGESRQCVIEKLSFTRMTPPDKNFSGFGGIITVTIRTV
jgi:hypothetical protein